MKKYKWFVKWQGLTEYYKATSIIAVYDYLCGVGADVGGIIAISQFECMPKEQESMYQFLEI